MTHQILDADADVALAPQPEPARDARIEPENLVLRPEQHGAFRHRGRQAAEFAQQSGYLRLVMLLAAIDPMMIATTSPQAPLMSGGDSTRRRRSQCSRRSSFHACAIDVAGENDRTEPRATRPNASPTRSDSEQHDRRSG